MMIVIGKNSLPITLPIAFNGVSNLPNVPLRAPPPPAPAGPPEPAKPNIAPKADFIGVITPAIPDLIPFNDVTAIEYAFEPDIFLTKSNSLNLSAKPTKAGSFISLNLSNALAFKSSNLKMKLDLNNFKLSVALSINLAPKPSVPILVTPDTKVAIPLIPFNCVGNLNISSSIVPLANAAKAVKAAAAAITPGIPLDSFSSPISPFIPPVGPVGTSCLFSLDWSLSRAACSLSNINIDLKM